MKKFTILSVSVAIGCLVSAAAPGGAVKSADRVPQRAAQEPGAVERGQAAAPVGAVPFIMAEIVEEVVPVFQDADDGLLLRPIHPPLDQIPPAPMPEPVDPVELRDPGEPIFHNAITGETIMLPSEEVRLGEFGQWPGYDGADGGLGTEEHTRTFWDMYKITNTEDFPWRMNVKLVMHFIDQSGSDRWFGCSGSMIDAETVLCAGHCVFLRDVDGTDIYNWAEEIYVYPGKDGDEHPYGYGRGTNFGAWTSWTQGGDFDADAGMIEITRAVGVLTGWFGKAWDGSCSWITDHVYNNASYPGENCPDPGLHTGVHMYYWSGYFDSCPGNNLQINTGGGHCFDTVWGGMSGSGAYYIDGGSRYVHAVCSTSNRYDVGRYCKLWGAFADFMNDVFIPRARGSAFDLQALDANAAPASIPAGSNLSSADFLATNPTNGSANGTWTVRTYLSTNDNISSSDTLLGTGAFNWNFGAMSSVRVGLGNPNIPVSTPPGDYWFGVILDPATDGNSGNNDTDGWDAVPITVRPPVPPNDSCYYATVITSTPYNPLLLNTESATSSTSDPYQSCSSGGSNKNSNTVWYRYTPPCNGTINVSTCGSNYNTVLSVYTGSCGSFTEIACNDNSCGWQSEINGLAVSGGQAYYIEVSDWNLPGGGDLDFHLDFTGDLPPNDECEGAIKVYVPSNTMSTTACATTDYGTPPCGTAVVTSPGVWYKVYGTGHTMTATTCNEFTTYDTKISVFCNDCDTLTCVDGNDDDCDSYGGNLSTVHWCSQYGAEYLILVHGYGGQSGGFLLDIYEGDNPCAPAVDCGGDLIGACCYPYGGDCQGGVCGASETCGGDPWCVCGFDVETGGRCFWGLTMCSAATPCPNGGSDCPDGEHCWAHSCCDGPICAADCPAMGAQNDDLALDEELRAMGPAGSVAARADESECIEIMEAACAGASGYYQGDGTSCTNIVCPGACCLAGECIGVLHEPECLEAGGIWFDGETCETVTCPVTGACCAPYGCTQGFVCGQGQLPMCNGMFMPCVCFTTAEGELACIDGWNQGCGDPCPGGTADCPAGSVCVVDTCCSGGGPVCLLEGCPLEPGAGRALEPGEFGPLGDAPFNQFLSQRDSGPPCVDVEEATCDMYVALYQGDGTICANTVCPGPLGACCVSGDCIGTTEEPACLEQGGAWYEGEDCDTFTCPGAPQACCFPDGHCEDLTQYVCLRAGGRPQGAGTDCRSTICPTLEACCMPDGRCAEMEPEKCRREYLGVSMGLGSVCLGDQNDNGIDDACEEHKPCEHCGPGDHWVDECKAGGDNMPSGALVGIDFSGDCVADLNAVLAGPVIIRRSNPLDVSLQFPGVGSPDGHRDVIDTEIVSMHLTGGGLALTAGLGLGNGGVLSSSLGAILELRSDPALATSFFEVYFEVDLGGGQFAYNHDPLIVRAVIDCVPPDATYIHPIDCIKLYDSPIPGQGQPVAALVQADHSTYPGCGDPTTGDCLEPNGTPFCNDERCCEIVCEREPDCCEVAWYEACVELAGHYCVTSPEACCLDDGTCVNTDPLKCRMEGGVPQGPDTKCTQEEACCLDDDGSCKELDPLCCRELGGKPQGVGTSCTRPEACCLDNGTCMDVDPLCCDDLGGEPQGQGTKCTAEEACCTPDATCEMLDPLCCRMIGGKSQGEGTRCSQQPVACCLDDGTCMMIDPLCCDEFGGVPMGPNSRCTREEACCLPDGPCEMLDPLCCRHLGGKSQGPETVCTETQACCLPDGTCIDTDPLCCDDFGGRLMGPNTQCTQEQACCLPDMSCEMLDPLCCKVLQGRSQGDGTVCTEREGCCLDDGTCIDVDPLCCDEFRGTPQGPGTACVDMTIACCLRDGSCMNVDPLCCDDMGGVPSPIGEPHCMGDLNGNGIDDACELPQVEQACCLPDGQCDVILPDECHERDGVPLGPGIECEGDLNQNGIDDACELEEPCEDCGPGPHWVDTCEGGGDNMPSSALVGIDFDGDCEADTTFRLNGPVHIWRSGPQDDSSNFPGLRPVDGHLDVLDTAIVSMNLTGGGIALVAGAGMGQGGVLRPTLGAIAEDPADDTMADSFFEVFFEVDLGGGQFAYNHDPMLVSSRIDCIPPDTTYIHPFVCIKLFDSPIPGEGAVVALLVRADHSTYPGCGDPGTGDCFEPHNTPFCEDRECCEKVCEQLPHCCEAAWDDACVELAKEICLEPPEACCLADGQCALLVPDQCRAHDGIPLGPGTMCEGDQNQNGIDDACETDDPCEDCGPGPHWVDQCAGGGDNMTSGALVGIDFSGDCVADTTVRLNGPVNVWRSDPLDDSLHFPGLRWLDGHLDVLDTEIVSMNLTNTAAGMAFTAGAGFGQGGVLRPSLGAIAEQPGNPAWADSFFNVFFEVDLGGGQFAYNHDPLHVASMIDCIPPDARYIHPFDCIKLFDSPFIGEGEVVAYLTKADHSTYPECGDPITGDCFVPNGTPFCDNRACCEMVCEFLPHCCDVVWDGPCAEMAREMCVCPEAKIVAARPDDGTLDARQPHEPHSLLPRQGIGAPTGPQGLIGEPITIVLDPPLTGLEHCFRLCETQVDWLLGPNWITSVTDMGGGRYDMFLHHAITAGAVTTIEYMGSGSFVEYTAHPANANADIVSSPDDILSLINCCLRGTCIPPWGHYSCDVDHSHRAAPADILRVIDLLNGADTYNPWLGTPRPVNNMMCP